MWDVAALARRGPFPFSDMPMDGTLLGKGDENGRMRPHNVANYPRAADSGEGTGAARST